MTAELCDCYPTKRDGVHAVLDAVSAALPGRPVVVWGLDGRFRPVDEVRRTPELAAAANWLALATVAARARSRGAGPAHRRRLDDHRPDPARRRRRSPRRAGPTPSGCGPASWFTPGSAGPRLRPRRPPPVPRPCDRPGRRAVRDDARRLPDPRRDPRRPRRPLDRRRPTRHRSTRAATAWRGWSGPTARGSPPTTPTRFAGSVEEAFLARLVEAADRARRGRPSGRRGLAGRASFWRRLARRASLGAGRADRSASRTPGGRRRATRRAHGRWSRSPRGTRRAEA